MRYFFHLLDGTYLADLEGTVLESDREAQREAMKASADMLKDIGPTLWDGRVWQMKVEDDTGRDVCSLIFRGELVDGTQH